MKKETLRMVKDKVDTFLQKLLWVFVPFMITGVITIVLMTYNARTDLQVMKAQATERQEIQQKTYDMTMKNQTILSTKLDISEYEIKHQEVLTRLDNITTKVDRLNYLHNLPIAKMEQYHVTNLAEHARINERIDAIDQTYVYVFKEEKLLSPQVVLNIKEHRIKNDAKN